MKFLNDQGIIQNEAGKDTSGSHARKWRLMFSKNGFIYPQVKKKDGDQEELGQLDDITPFGRTFLKADTYPAVQECYLRALSVEQFAMPDGNSYFSPLRWMLAIMLELEKRTGSSENLHYGDIQQIRVIQSTKLWTIFWICVFVEKRPRQNVILIGKKWQNVGNTMIRKQIIFLIIVT